MGRLFIRMVNGEPFEHPIFEENFKQAFPEVDIDNLPEGYAEFIRVEQPILGPYVKSQSVQYVKGEDGLVRDVWSEEMMNEEEKIAKQNEVKDEWVALNRYASWTFNEETCEFDPPVPRPEDGEVYWWDEEEYESDNTQGWVLYTPPEE
jgi:hypothetical protein